MIDDSTHRAEGLLINEIFWPDDARQVLQFAREKDIRYLSFWSIDRDEGNSGISSGRYEFSHVFSGFNS